MSHFYKLLLFTTQFYISMNVYINKPEYGPVARE